MQDAEAPAGTTCPPPPTAGEILRQMVALVCYAEFRAMFLSWAGITWDPVPHTWAALRRLLDELDEPVSPGAPAFLERGYEILRKDSRVALEAAVRRAGPWPFDLPIGRGQIGSLPGLEEAFHEAGVLARHHRADDRRLMSHAIRMTDFALRSPVDPMPA